MFYSKSILLRVKYLRSKIFCLKIPGTENPENPRAYIQRAARAINVQSVFYSVPVLAPCTRRRPGRGIGSSDGELLGSAGAACPAHARPMRPEQPRHHRHDHLQRPSTDVGAGPVVGAATAAGAYLGPERGAAGASAAAAGRRGPGCVALEWRTRAAGCWAGGAALLRGGAAAAG